MIHDESRSNATITYVGGPTLLLEIGGLRLLTDPTLDRADSVYPTPAYTLHKLQGPGVDAAEIGPIDAVLLSHDHHWDNLDRGGREVLARAGRVLTTRDGAVRLGGDAVGMNAWQSIDVATPSGRALRITATPARHGPPGGDRGPCVGFVLSWADAPQRGWYISGDTVWYEGVAQVADRFDVDVAVLFLGAAKVAAAGPSHLTMTAAEAVQAARAFSRAIIVPAHFEGWAHFSEGRREISSAFELVHMTDRLRWLRAGNKEEFEFTGAT